MQRTETPRVKARITVISVWMIAILLWPVLWFHTVPEQFRTVESIPGLLWPILILIIDIFSMRHNTYESQLQSKRSMLSADANTICSLTFAISSIIGAQKHECCRKIFMYAIVACIAFVIPAPHAHTNAIETIAIEAGQKAVLAYATGLLLGGIMLTSFAHNNA